MGATAFVDCSNIIPGATTDGCAATGLTGGGTQDLFVTSMGMRAMANRMETTAFEDIARLDDGIDMGNGDGNDGGNGNSGVGILRLPVMGPSTAQTV
jgi:hypothetical protein